MPQQPPPADAHVPRSRRVRALLLVAVALIGVGLGVAGTLLFTGGGGGGDEGPGPAQGAGPTPAEAALACQDHVLERLKSPGSAQFQQPTDIKVNGKGLFTVSASVDSQNGFGALLRTSYTCVIRHIGDGRWSVERLSL